VYDDQFGIENPPKILNKGFRCVRRDVDAFTRQSQIKLLKHVHDRDVHAVNKAAHEAVRQLPPQGAGHVAHVLWVWEGGRRRGDDDHSSWL
jgi:hypothetical protein